MTGWTGGAAVTTNAKKWGKGCFKLKKWLKGTKPARFLREGGFDKAAEGSELRYQRLLVP